MERPSPQSLGTDPPQTIRGWGWTPQNLLSLDSTIAITWLLVAPLHPDILDSTDDTGGPPNCQRLGMGPPKSPGTGPHHLVAPTHPDILDRTKNTVGEHPKTIKGWPWEPWNPKIWAWDLQSLRLGTDPQNPLRLDVNPQNISEPGHGPPPSPSETGQGPPKPLRAWAWTPKILWHWAWSPQDPRAWGLWVAPKNHPSLNMTPPKPSECGHLREPPEHPEPGHSTQGGS